MKIEDGTGKGYEAGVNSKNELKTSAVSASIQHIASLRDKQAYQVNAQLAVNTSEENILLLKNTSDSEDLVITYIRLHTAGAAATNSTAFFSVKAGGDYASGGTAITPTNVYVGSANAADALAYDSTGSDIVTSGTYLTLDKLHQSEVEIAYNKEGSLILPKNQSILISHIGSTVAGIAYARISFFYGEPQS